MLGTILLVVLVLLLIGALPNLGVVNYGYGPSGILGVILIIVLILALSGHGISI